MTEAVEQKYDWGGEGELAREASKQAIIHVKCPRRKVKNLGVGGGG